MDIVEARENPRRGGRSSSRNKKGVSAIAGKICRSGLVSTLAEEKHGKRLVHPRKGGDASRTSKALLAEMDQFFERSLAGQIRGTVDLGRLVFEYREWDGARLAGNIIAFDTETSLIEGPATIPQLALATAIQLL